MATAFPSKYAQSAGFGEMAIAKGRNGKEQGPDRERAAQSGTEE